MSKVILIGGPFDRTVIDLSHARSITLTFRARVGGINWTGFYTRTTGDLISVDVGKTKYPSLNWKGVLV